MDFEKWWNVIGCKAQIANSEDIKKLAEEAHGAGRLLEKILELNNEYEKALNKKKVEFYRNSIYNALMSVGDTQKTRYILNEALNKKEGE